jgi:hypothetical protein
MKEKKDKPKKKEPIEPDVKTADHRPKNPPKPPPDEEIDG